MSILEHDGGLPALPLPELKDTLTFAEELIAPLVDERTLEATRAALTDFARPGGAGEILQRELTALRGQLPANASWLRPFWDDMYLSWREPLPINMNYILCLDAERWGGANALPRFLRGLAIFMRRIGQNSLEPEATRAGFLSMEQIQSCVYTRIPAPDRDILRPTPLAGPQHIAVTRNGHWFILDICGPNGALAAEKELAAALEQLRRQADSLPPGPAISAFSSADRGTACALRSELQQNEQNRLNLAAIESATLVLCLDGPHATDEDLCRRLLCGDSASRWFDKSLQVIASDAHGLGLNFEHSGCDAGIWLYLLTGIDELLLADAAASIPEKATENGFQPGFRHLRWIVHSDLAGRLEKARADFSASSAQLDLSCAVFQEFSREAAKKLGASPDAFLHLSFQAAQHAIFGRLRSTYEAVSMRSFQQGRTEAGRSSTAEALAFVEALHSNAASGKPLELYRQAESAHAGRLGRCQKGLGAERHLYALQHIWAMRGMELKLGPQPAIFSDAGWQTLKHDALSTSGIGAPFIRFFGFGPVVADGLGVGYAPNGAFTGLLISAFKNSSPEAGLFIREFRRAAEAIATLLRG